jgi:hypothetical protein
MIGQLVGAARLAAHTLSFREASRLGRPGRGRWCPRQLAERVEAWENPGAGYGVVECCSLATAVGQFRA